MANTKVTQHVIANNAISAGMIQSAAVTDAKLHSTLDLSGKTLTLPSAAVATTQSASDNSTKIATTAYVETAISNLVDSSPSSLNTLNELAAALNDDASFSTTVTNSLATKLPLAGGTLTGDLILGDNVRIELGSASGGDLRIYHDGSNSIIADEGDGGLFLRGSNTVDIQSALGHNYIKSTLGAGTKIYHNNTEKFETTDYGASTSGTGAFKLPVGTTAQRPTAATGQIRFNSTDGKLEIYNGSAWANVSAGTSNKTLDTFTGDGSTTAFTLTETPANEDALIVFIDGAYQEKGDYSLSGKVLTLDVAPLSGEKIAVHTTIGAVHDGTAALNQQFTGDGSTTAFTLSAAPQHENNTQVYINGVYQQKTDYTVSGTTLTFDTAPTNGDIIEVNSFTVTNLGGSDSVTEGVSNLYFTNARARSAVSVSGNAISYNSSTGVLTANFEEGPVFTGTVTSAGLAVDTDTLVVDSTNNRVGIGNTSPGVKLDVTGEVRSTSQVGYRHVAHAIESGHSSAHSTQIGRWPSSGARWLIVPEPEGSPLYSREFGYNFAADKWFVEGNFGIGLTDAQSELHVQNSSSGATPTSNTVATFEGNDNTEVSILGGSSSVLALNFGHSGDNNEGVLYFNTTSGSENLQLESTKDITLRTTSTNATAGDINFKSYNTTIMHIDGQNNNVGIGTTTPTISALSGATSTRCLEIGNIGNDTASGIRLQGNNNTGTPGQSTTTEMIHRGDALYFHLRHGGSDAFVINSGRDVHFNAGSTDFRLRGGVYGSLFDSNPNMNHNIRYHASAGLYFNVGPSNANFVFEQQGTGRFTISSSGGSPSSDVKLKENIEDIDYGLDTVKQLRPRKFQWKGEDVPAGEKDDIGFIAQEVEAIIPEVVNENIHPDDPGDGSRNIKRLDYGHLTSVLVKAVQEQQTIIEDLKSRIETLEG